MSIKDPIGGFISVSEEMYLMTLVKFVFILLLLISCPLQAAENSCSQKLPTKRKSRIQATEEQIEEVWRRLAEVTDINPRAIRLRTPNPIAEDIIEEVLGKRYNVATVYNYARTIKPYAQWIIDAGLKTDQVFKAVDALSPEEIIGAIKGMSKHPQFVRSGYKLRAHVADTDDFVDLIEAETGRRVRPSQVFYAAVRYHKKPWSYWLKEAGF